ncbi:hypothetical protein CIP107503_00119 [Corynebacterium diphtheriae]|uniref:hypothetical protein n=1 Tax=Corynebacterium diphtheriae TaxID=1717 RepID=UPI000B4C1D86|nr:hypothetical protein [Corynebacterium diphtheriae]OWN38211.1 hypothetical protein AY510_10600 [Corynebacterium diphtheriae bv. gravis]OWN66285.1 hypothetical protein AY518_08070 [Corynebacterium diphtheriae bv. gravis]OWO19694.1 hypothetical protein AY535_05190 [Corynebacterium diphtheriae bv. gravis]OWO49894.1 hypothetical protein AY551_01735 [Corynebacterium diphtheriae bv. gravis]UEB76585.1 hypothetical protein LK463_04095 [Corynebacterium diphtheriae]
MPKLKGSLKNITDKPSTIREVLLRATHTRTNGKTITTSEPVRVKVSESGDFTETLAPGAAVLVLVGADFMARESIPLLVAEGMTTIAEAMEAAEDFTPEVHDKLAELAAEVARGVKSTGEAVKATAAAREKVEAAAEAVEASSSAAKAAEASVSSAWQQVKARLAQWEERVQQLDRWQPQYEWLKENAASSFAGVQEKITQATQQIVSQVRGDAEAVKRDAATAGQHSLKAQAAAKSVESAAQSAVDAVVKKILDGAPQAYDTLKEVADELASQKSAAAALIKQLSEKASQADVATLAQKITNLSIDGVRGLSEALASKASSSHTHKIADITALQKVLSKHTVMINECGVEIGKKADKSEIAGMASKSDVQQLQATVNAAPKIMVVSQMPAHPDSQTIYVVR